MKYKSKDERQLDALDYAISAAFLRSFPRKPGAVIEALPEETRKELREITADPTWTLRPDVVLGQTSVYVGYEIRHIGRFNR
jgi:hypothetical protein